MKTSIFKMIGVFALVLGAVSIPHETARSSQKAPEYTGRSAPVVLFNCPRNKKC